MKIVERVAKALNGLNVCLITTESTQVVIANSWLGVKSAVH